MCCWGWFKWLGLPWLFCRGCGPFCCNELIRLCGRWSLSKWLLEFPGWEWLNLDSRSIWEWLFWLLFMLLPPENPSPFGNAPKLTLTLGNRARNPSCQSFACCIFCFSNDNCLSCCCKWSILPLEDCCPSRRRWSDTSWWLWFICWLFRLIARRDWCSGQRRDWTTGCCSLRRDDV